MTPERGVGGLVSSLVAGLAVSWVAEKLGIHTPWWACCLVILVAVSATTVPRLEAQIAELLEAVRRGSQEQTRLAKKVVLLRHRIERLSREASAVSDQVRSSAITEERLAEALRRVELTPERLRDVVEWIRADENRLQRWNARMAPWRNWCQENPEATPADKGRKLLELVGAPDDVKRDFPPAGYFNPAPLREVRLHGGAPLLDSLFESAAKLATVTDPEKEPST